MEHVGVVLQVAIIVLLILHMRSERKWRDQFDEEHEMLLESFDMLDEQQRELKRRVDELKSPEVKYTENSETSILQ
jgi:chaperonin cofactor prefoldin